MYMCTYVHVHVCTNLFHHWSGREMFHDGTCNFMRSCFVTSLFQHLQHTNMYVHTCTCTHVHAHRHQQYITVTANQCNDSCAMTPMQCYLHCTYMINRRGRKNYLEVILAIHSYTLLTSNQRSPVSQGSRDKDNVI